MKKCFLIFMLIVFNFLFVFSDEISMFDALFSGNVDFQDIFSKEFLNLVSEGNISKIVDYYNNAGGVFLGFNKDKNVLEFERGEAKVVFSVKDGKFVSLQLKPIVSTNLSFDDIVNKLKSFSSDFSITIKKDGKEKVFDFNSNKPMAVGSAFKLYVLKALQDRVNNKKTSYSRVFHLNKKNLSLPSGILQKWAHATPITLRSLANFMISMSDNTATDNLIDYLGVENIESLCKSYSKPFLKTSQMFKFKLNDNKKLMQKYSVSDLKGKRKIIKEVSNQDLPDLSMALNWNNPINIKDVEWFFSTEDLCAVIYDLRDNESLYINDSGIFADNWYKVGFKGGSEPGVLNLTYVIKKTENSPFYTLSLTFNDSNKVLDENLILASVSNLMSYLYNN